MKRRSLLLAAAAAAAGTLTTDALPDVEVAGDRGPSTQGTPFLVPTAQGVRFVSILTTGESVNPKFDGVTPYRMLGLPDGMGAFDNGDGTFTLLSNHEIGSASGTVRAHGSTGATVSAWVVEKDTLKVVNGADLIRTVLTWSSATQAWVQGTTAFQRLCSADLPEVSALFDAATGDGCRDRILLSGEESSAGRAFAHIATGPNAGVSVELPRMGRDAWENVVPCPFAQERTVVVGIDDSSPGQVYVYVGTKTGTGSEVQRAGLANGRLYGVLANAARAEDRTLGIGLAKGASGPFTLLDMGDASVAGYSTETTADTLGVTEWLRPEDGAWDPLNPADFYFVTTDRFDQTKNGSGAQVGRSRLWRLRFSDLARPEQGGTVTLLLDGTEAHNMFDNLCVDRLGHVILQEDPGNVAWQARIWRYTIATGDLTELGRHDAARFGNETTAATSPFSQDEESSGVIDAADLLGPGWYLLNVQAHGGVSPGAEIVENGQFLAMYDPSGAASPTFSVDPVALPAASLVGQVVTFRADAEIPGDGTLTYAWSFGDGTNGTGPTSTHAYAAPGTYAATCTVTHTASGRTVSDTVQVTVSRPMTQTSLAVTLDFARPSKDGLVLRGTLALPAGFAPAGRQVSVDVGGVARTFTLDAKGRGASDGATFALPVRKVRGSVPAQRATFTMTLRNASLQASFADEGLTNSTVAGANVEVDVEVVFGGERFQSVADVVYSAKEGKKGVAR